MSLGGAGNGQPCCGCDSRAACFRGWAAMLEAFDKNGQIVDKASVAVVPGRTKPEDPVPTFELTVNASGIAYLRVSGPRKGEFLAPTNYVSGRSTTSGSGYITIATNEPQVTNTGLNNGTPAGCCNRRRTASLPAQTGAPFPVRRRPIR